MGSPLDMVVVPPRHCGDLLVANRTETALLLPEQPLSPSAHQGPGHLHAETFLGAETGTQLESITSCVPVSSPSRSQMVCDLLLGGTQAELLHHHLDEDGLVLFGQDDPGEKRFHGQAATSHALFALPDQRQLTSPPKLNARSY